MLTREVIFKIFGKLSHTVWPVIESKEELKSYYIRLSIREFLDFQKRFDLLIEGFKDIADPRSLYKEQIEQLRVLCQARPEYQLFKRPGVTQSNLFRLDSQKEVPNFSEYKRQRNQNSSFHSEQSFAFDDAPRFKRGGTNNNKPDQVFVLNKDPDQTSVLSEPDSESIADDSRIIVHAAAKKSKLKIFNQEEQKLRESELVTKPTPKEDELPKPRHYNLLQNGWQDTKNGYLEMMRDMRMPRSMVQQIRNELCFPNHYIKLLQRQYQRYLILSQVGQSSIRFIYPHAVKLMWEYHMIQTDNYYDFCMMVFRKFIHFEHFPREPDDKMVADYKYTIDAYQQVFNDEPPNEIWLDVKRRFKTDNIYNYKYVNVREYMMSRVEASSVKGRVYRMNDKRARLENHEAEKARGDMEVMEEPQRGAVISIKKKKKYN